LKKKKRLKNKKNGGHLEKKGYHLKLDKHSLKKKKLSEESFERLTISI